jgi:hypothetical protein
MAAVTNSKTGQKFNQLFPNGIPSVKMDEFLGCFGNRLKFSYVISAPLHMKGFFQFWAKDHQYAPIDRLAVTFDLIIHLAAWIAALVLDIWANAQDNRGSEILQEVNMVALWSLIVALSGILVAQFFALTAGGQEAGKLFPSTYGVIVGGAYTSILFSFMWLMHSFTWAALVNQYSDSSGGEELKQQRHAVMWTLALKVCAVVTLEKNASFWGPCTIDEEKEAEEKTAQYYKQNGLEYNA